MYCKFFGKLATMEFPVHFSSCLLLMIYTILMVSTVRCEEVEEEEICPDGDIAKNICWNIRPHHCYNENHRRMCCETCKNFPKTNIPNCQYGDYYVIWDAEFGPYTCQSYVSMLGYRLCRRKFLFYSKCCESCHGHETDE